MLEYQDQIDREVDQEVKNGLIKETRNKMSE
jgi:hypothetical protein